ncbi:Orotidine 5'-phosphate decarboxylase [Lunatimonas lonarensis]|uniref:Orotidine 5'-phosphate decarboxylase n=1 Tax=Lunatimonas lonarensis TaxID=1232681 RepID=R7ZSY6_9BACT|nr:orotidine-5'-phosphate decarboxylase [Lunatimonas lonarensis]EON77250.1 Orotidine 5'-phosphate decarboxylase [Lunatimonas lonarensis]
MNKSQLVEQIRQKQSYLCVGLDPSLEKIPSHLLKEKDPVFAFNKVIIDETLDFAVAYKPNTAFYEALGPSGWESLEKTLEYLPSSVLKIADAKRGDIGNTSTLYAKAFFETLKADAITVAPYMGKDSVAPFLEFEGKWVILLALTSNTGSLDFQLFQDTSGTQLFEEVLKKSQTWGTVDNLMYVVGATRGEKIADVRKIIPDHFLLVPGVGAQGGSLQDVAKYGMNDNVGLLVNSSRGILYASSGVDFGKAARNEAHKLQEEMEQSLQEYGR